MINDKDKELENIQRHINFTKIKELESEVKTKDEECAQLKQILEDTLHS